MIIAKLNKSCEIGVLVEIDIRSLNSTNGRTKANQKKTFSSFSFSINYDQLAIFMLFLSRLIFFAHSITYKNCVRELSNFMICFFLVFVVVIAVGTFCRLHGESIRALSLKLCFTSLSIYMHAAHLVLGYPFKLTRVAQHKKAVKSSNSRCQVNIFRSTRKCSCSPTQTVLRGVFNAIFK